MSSALLNRKGGEDHRAEIEEILEDLRRQNSDDLLNNPES
jgi:hypothetical protein